MPSTNIKITATDKSKAAFTSAQRSVNALKGSIGLLKGALLGYISIAGAKAFVNFANQQRDMADTIGKMSDRLKITTRELQEFRFAGELSGETVETMDNNFVKFVRNIDEARQGVAKVRDEFINLKINLKDANGNWKNHGDLLREVADRYKETNDPARKLGSAMTLFGRGGRSMVNMLSTGSEGLDRFAGQLRKAGGIISEDFVRSSEEANDRLTLMGKIWTAITTRSLKPFNKAILDTSDAYLKIKGIDPTADMTLRRLREVHAELDTAISKTANKQRDFNKANTLTTELQDVQNKQYNKEIFNLLKTQNLIEARIKNSKNAKQAEVELSNVRLETGDKEIKKTFEITQAQQKMHSSSLTMAFEAHAQRNKKSDEEIAKQQELRAQIIEFRRTEEQQVTADIMIEHARRKEIILEYLAGEGVANTEKNALILANTRDTAEKLKAIDQEKKDSAIATSKEMIRSMGSANESWFQANKALAISDTIMATYQAATKALTIPPPWVGMAYAATITGLGMANVNRIRNEKYQGRALGGTVQSGKPYIVGEQGAELFTPSQTGSITPNDRMGGTNVTFNIQTNDAEGFDDLLQDRRGMIVSMINRAANETGRGNLI